jgi:hypothetical protein
MIKMTDYKEALRELVRTKYIRGGVILEPLKFSNEMGNLNAAIIRDARFMGFPQDKQEAFLKYAKDIIEDKLPKNSCPVIMVSSDETTDRAHEGERLPSIYNMECMKNPYEFERRMEEGRKRFEEMRKRIQRKWEKIREE